MKGTLSYRSNSDNIISNDITDLTLYIFMYDLHKIVIPSNVTKLKIRFCSTTSRKLTLTPNILPNHIKELNIKMGDYLIITKGSIPDGVEKLVLKGFNQPLFKNIFPDSIRYLRFHGDCNSAFRHQLNAVFLPSNLKMLFICNPEYDRRFDNNLLPKIVNGLNIFLESDGMKINPYYRRFMICGRKFSNFENHIHKNHITEEEVMNMFYSIRFFQNKDNHQLFTSEAGKPSRLEYAYQSYLSYCDKYEISENDRISINDLAEMYGNTDLDILYNPHIYGF